MVAWGNVASWVGLGLSIVVAVNQFGAARPSLQVEPNPRDLTRPPKFSLRVHNPTGVAVHLNGHWGTTKAPVPAGLTVTDGGRVLQTGTFNLRVPAGKTALMSVRVPERKPLLLIIRWRRLSGIHLFQFVPLFLFLTRRQVEALWQAQTEIDTVE